MTPDGELEPGLAEGWEALEDGLTYTFELRGRAVLGWDTRRGRGARPQSDYRCSEAGKCRVRDGLTVLGVPVDRVLRDDLLHERETGSIIVVVATDAPDAQLIPALFPDAVRLETDLTGELVPEIIEIGPRVGG